MSTSDSESNKSSKDEPQRKTVGGPIYTYAVSWKWMVIGLIVVLGFVGVAGTLYSLQSSNMSTKILDVVQRMIEESDKDKAQLAQTNDRQEKTELILHSLKLRGDAANLLNDYRQANPDNVGSAVLEKLYEILESLYEDYGQGTTSRGTQRGEQLSALASELINIVNEAESIKYHARLLELAWDRRSYSDIISRGLALLKASRTVGGAENADYDAMRYIAMALFDHLPVEPYQRSLNKLPAPPFPETMDELLEKLNTMKPEDIEIAKRYAEFIVSVDKPNFSACSSDQLRGRSLEERNTLAKNRIDDMVQRNPDNPSAFLARYHFISQFMPVGAELDQSNPDLEMTLKIAPDNPEGLILSSLDALRQMEIAARNGENERALDWQNKAEDFFRRTIKSNPTDPFGYQYLGDYLMFVKKQPQEAIETWKQGLDHSNNRGDEELIGRLVMVLLDQRTGDAVEEVREKLEHLSRTIAEMQYSRPMDVRRTTDMLELLTAQLYYTEAKIAIGRVAAAQQENRLEEVRRLYGVIQQKQGDAMQKYDRLLRDFGKTSADYEYILEKRSVYNLLIPQSLMQVGELKSDWNQWDAAASYFERASRFPSVKQQALLAMSMAYQSSKRLDQATQALKLASEADPDNLRVRYTYAMTLFRWQVGSSNPDSAAFDTVQKELEFLESRRSELQQPWALDIRLIHLGVARADTSNSAERILEAMNEALRKFRTLEQGTFPPDAEGNVRNYIDDPAFVGEMVGIYSGLSARSDFDRLLLKLREFPDGEGAYFDARINDSLRRDDRKSAVAVISEAIESTRLSDARKDRFIALLQTLRGENVDNTPTLDKLYTQLQTTFDRSPESLKPQAFFLFAKLSLERSEMEQTKQIMERLKKIEGPEGRNWQYIDIRLMLAEKDPDYALMRQKQENVAKVAPDWDETYILAALIEEQYYAANPGDTESQNRLIAAYQTATQCGNAQPEVWRRLIQLLASAGRTEESNTVARTALLRGLNIQTQTGQLPDPYNNMYIDIQEALASDDGIGADGIARQCIILAERRGERPDLIFSLHLLLGKAFLESSLHDSAIRHLAQTAKRGGTFVYPLALAVAKSGNVDGGFSLLLDEIDLVPTAAPELLPSVLILLTQVQPSEVVYERIDRMIERIEKGERLSRDQVALDTEGGNIVPLGSQWTPYRKIQSMVVRFPEKTENIDSASIQFIAPEGLASDVPAEQPPVQPAQPTPATPIPSAQPVPVAPQTQPVPTVPVPPTQPTPTTPAPLTQPVPTVQQ